MTKDEEKWIVRVVGIFMAIIVFAFLLGMATMYGWLALNHQILALEEDARCIYDSIYCILYIL